jgi:hypothetical protein
MRVTIRCAHYRQPAADIFSWVAMGRRANDYKVIMDMPDPLPITEAEIELLESELTDFIAELLKK